MDFSSIDTSNIGIFNKRAESKAPFSTGYTTTQGLLADGTSSLDARMKAGMPKAGAAHATGAPIGTAGAGDQKVLADRLKLIAAGGPTAGSQQLGAATDAAKRGLYAAAFSRPTGSGANLAAGLRSAANTGSLMDAQAARQADILRAQEQQAALGQYAGLASSMASSDLSESNEANKIALANAGFKTQSDLANQSAALNWQQMNDAQRRALLGMGIDLNQSDFDNRLDYYSALRGNEMALINASKQKQAADNARDAQLLMSVTTFGLGGKGG
jgi:hypothetical protein